MIKPDADIYTRFFTYNSSGVLTDDDGTPVGVLVKNGTDTAETVTVTKLATGSYKAEFTIPSDAATGDMFELQITVTMSTVVQKDIIWRDIVDTYANSDVVTELRNTSGFEKIIPKTMLIPTANSNVYMIIVVADSPDNSEVGVTLVGGDNTILYEDAELTTPLSASATFEDYYVMVSLNAKIYLCYVKVDHTETARQYNYIFVYAKNSVEYYHTSETSLIDEDVVVKRITTDVITADAIKTDAIAEIQSGLAASTDVTTVEGKVDDIISTLGVAGAGLTALGDTRIANLDAAVTTRMAAFSYTAPDNQGIADIKTATDKLNFNINDDVIATLDGEKVTVTSIDNDVITAAVIKADAITEIQTGLATSLEVTTADEKIDGIISTIGDAGAGLTALGDTRLANLDDSITSRMESFTYTAPDNQGIMDIKAVTDKINFNMNDDVIATLDSEKVTVSSIDNDAITAASIKADAVTEIQTGLATSLGVTAVEGKVDGIVSTLGISGAGLTAIGDTRLANLDAAITTRMSSFTYTAPDNASISSIKAKTDQLAFSSGDVIATLNGEAVSATISDKTGYTLTADYDAAKTAASQTSVNTIDGIVDAIKAKTDTIPADPATNTQVNTRMATFVYTAPDNSSISAIKAKTDNLSFTGTDVKATLDGETVAASISDKTGFALISDYDAAKTAASQTSVNTVDGIVDAIKAKTDNLPADPASNTQVATRLASASYTAPDNVSVAAIKAKTDQLTFSSGDVIATLNGETVVASSVTDKTGYYLANDAISSATIAASAVTEIQSGLATSSALSAVDGVVDAIKAKTDNLPSDPASNTVVNTRLAAAAYTAPDNVSITAIKERTDNLPNDPATETSLSTIDGKIDTLQLTVESGNDNTPTVEDIVTGILSGAIDGNIDLQTATKKILSVISNNMYATVNSTDILYEYKNSDNSETVVAFRVTEDGTSRESE